MMHRFIGMCVLVVVAAEAYAARRVAIVIGVDEYEKLGRLQFCATDARDLSEQLAAAGFSAQDIVTLKTSPSEPALLPNLANIEQQLKHWIDDWGAIHMAKDDLLVITFSGHGVFVDGKSYLCPSNADPADPTTMIRVGDVFSRLGKCAGKKVMVIDACRNIAGARAANERTQGFAKGVKSEAENVKNLVLLSSCGPEQESFEFPELGRGLFMNSVLEGLRYDADADDDGQITVLEICEYATKETKKFIVTKGRVQVPTFNAREAESIVLGSVSRSFTNRMGMQMQRIEPGKFKMGSPESETGHSSDELQSDQAIPRAYYLGVHEITHGQFQAIMGASKAAIESSNVAAPVGLGPPATGVRFVDALRFCNRLSLLERRTPVYDNLPETDDKPGQLKIAFKPNGYRLPSEIEWEYACRAGTKTAFSFGPSLAVAQARFGGEAFPNDVKSFAPNAWGLYDMHGNVWEWCIEEDLISGSRILRGGGFSTPEHGCRSAVRRLLDPAATKPDVGFRVVLQKN